MAASFAYRDFWSGHLALGDLRFELDYSIWLYIRYDGKPDTFPVSLLAEPRAAHDAAVTAHLTEHKADLVSRYQECPKCGRTYLGSLHQTCPGVARPKDGQQSGEPPCGEQLVQLYRIDEPESWLREQATFALARRDDLVSRRHVVSEWLLHRFYRAESYEKMDVARPLREILDHLREMVEHELGKFYHHVPSVDLHLDGRRDLLPRGQTIVDKHTDYLTTRDKIISAHQRLLGLAKDLPDFVDDYEAPAGMLNAPSHVELLTDPKPVLIRAEFIAYQSYKDAEKRMNIPAKTKRDVYDWIVEYSEYYSEDDKPPSFETWARYIRTATKQLG